MTSIALFLTAIAFFFLGWWGRQIIVEAKEKADHGDQPQTKIR